MSEVYRIQRADGSWEFTDVPQGAGRVERVQPGRAGGSTAQDEEQRKQAYQEARSLIKEAQKRIPRLIDYLDYLSYLRHHSPQRLDRVLRELQRSDPQTWLKLQKYPQFRPLRDTVLGLKAADKQLAAGIGLATGSLTGSAEKWLETTVKDMMKRDRFGPYAEVLGAKASTLPAAKPPYYSNSRLGQYLKQEDARQAAAAKAAAKELDTARAAYRGARSTAISRGLNPLLDLGLGALDPDVFRGASAIQGMRLRKQLVEKQILSEEEAYPIPGMLARGEYEQLKRLIEDGIQRRQQRP